MNVLIAGGGTGGHLFPAIALAQELRRRDATCRILFVGSPRGIEVRAVPKAGFDLELLPVSGLRRTGIAGLASGLAKLPLALFAALRLVRRFRPSIAVSVGGYAAGPAVLAARLSGVPCVVMEQNAVPGFTNRCLGKLSRRVFAALPVRGFASDKVRVLGNPVRADLLAVREAPYRIEEPLQLLVFGGSQGARAINETMMALAPLLKTARRRWRIVHQAGKSDAERVSRAYTEAGLDGCEVLPFIDDMASAYARAHLVLCRAGATTIAELTVCGRPSILVPFPFAVDDHQAANARALAARGAAIVLPQTELDAPRLFSLLDELGGDPERLHGLAAAARENGKPEAVAQIADALQEEARV